jgi:polar amino acid transport system substrate-binding protein
MTARTTARYARWLPALALLLGLCVPLATGAEPLRLNSGVRSPYFKLDKTGFIDLLVPEVFRRIGIVAEGVQYAASERAMLNANNGIDDGLVLRIRGLEKAYPNLVIIDEKIIDNEFVAYATNAKFATTSFDSLRNLEVGYINGWKIFEANVPSGTAITKVQEAEQLFRLLEQSRIDVVLYERWQGNQILKETGSKAEMLAPPLATSEMFMYLHKKHAHLAEPAARALREMKKDGTWRRIAERSLPGFGGK